MFQTTDQECGTFLRMGLPPEEKKKHKKKTRFEFWIAKPTLTTQQIPAISLLVSLNSWNLEAWLFDIDDIVCTNTTRARTHPPSAAQASAKHFVDKDGAAAIAAELWGIRYQERSNIDRSIYESSVSQAAERSTDDSWPFRAEW